MNLAPSNAWFEGVLLCPCGQPLFPDTRAFVFAKQPMKHKFT